MRTPAERVVDRFTRCFESKERVEWINWLPCLVCGTTPCHNAHIETGGTGRRADSNKVVPACPAHHLEMDEGDGKEAFEQKYGLNLAEIAARVEHAWRLIADHNAKSPTHAF